MSMDDYNQGYQDAIDRFKAFWEMPGSGCAIATSVGISWLYPLNCHGGHVYALEPEPMRWMIVAWRDDHRYMWE